MDNQKCHVRKTLVRNVEVKVPRQSDKHCRKLVVGPEDPKETIGPKGTKGPEKLKSEDVSKLKPKSILKKSNEELFVRPQLNTINKLARQIDNIEKTAAKSAYEPTNSEMLELKKKVGAKMNFHINEAIYKDLVALNIQDSTPMVKSRRPGFVSSFVKDIEPNLEDFFEHKLIKDKPIMVPAVGIKTHPVSGYDGREIFRKFQEYESQSK